MALTYFMFFYNIISAFLAPLEQISHTPNLTEDTEHLYYTCLIEDVKTKK